eukprot:s331_g11.t1
MLITGFAAQQKNCGAEVNAYGLCEDRSETGTCTVDGGFVCLQLLDSAGKPREFMPGKDWWDVTGQSAHKWDDRIRSNHGDSWCVCATCASEIVDLVGCQQMPIRCNATNMKDVFGIDLPIYASLDTCLRTRCPEVQGDLRSWGLWEALAPTIGSGSGPASLSLVGAAELGLGATVVVAATAVLLRRFATHVRYHYQLLSGDSSDEEADLLLDSEAH